MQTQSLQTETGVLSPQREAELLGQISALKSQLEETTRELANLKKMVYGQKSEKSEVILAKAEQIDLFNEAEENANKEVRQREKDVIVPEHKRKSKRTHEETFENLPVEEVIHEVEDKACPECGEQMVTVGIEFIRDELVYVPARLFVRKHYAEVVKCPICGEDESLDANRLDVPAPVFRKATAPLPLIEHSYCSPELLAHIIYEKYAKQFRSTDWRRISLPWESNSRVPLWRTG